MEKKPVTGKYSIKPYQCTKCGHESKHGTNHWGEIYPLCPHCGNSVLACLEPVPEGYEIPEKWRSVKLSEILETNNLSLSAKTYLGKKII